ncbi:glycosyltransferase [Pseudaeromonas sp. ZJS20]|uniref:glycosyltransferase n=1 Tax=Pseudaeromonas aegiceratis TaxID=3153928 RepID=UPI00390CB7F3
MKSSRRICVVVVSYGQNPFLCETYSSLAGQLGAFNDHDLLIYVRNNGPIYYDLDFEPSTTHPFVYTQSVGNVSLASIYNDAINYRENDFVLIFDQDTHISAEYIQSILNNMERNDVDLLIPKIMAKGKQHYPRDKSGVIASGEYQTMHARLTSISSGLMIGRKLIEKFKQTYSSVFDENFVLYGVDSSFFLRLRHLMKIYSIKIVCDGELLHSLSSHEVEADSVKLFRSCERLYDLALQLRYYPRLSMIYLVPRELLKVVLLHKKPSLLLDFFRVAVSGKHPRGNK